MEEKHPSTGKKLIVFLFILIILLCMITGTLGVILWEDGSLASLCLMAILAYSFSLYKVIKNNQK